MKVILVQIYTLPSHLSPSARDFIFPNAGCWSNEKEYICVCMCAYLYLSNNWNSTLNIMRVADTEPCPEVLPQGPEAWAGSRLAAEGATWPCSSSRARWPVAARLTCHCCMAGMCVCVQALLLPLMCVSARARVCFVALLIVKWSVCARLQTILLC
jgi:hypothetical protein